MEALERRIAAIESQLALHRLAAEYCHGADKRDRDPFAAVWTTDAVWLVGPDAAFRGVDAICDAVARQWAAFPEMHHLTTNHVVSIAGHRAEGESDVAVAVRSADGRWYRGGGTYRDIYERRDGRWLISRREVSVSYDLDPRPAR